MPPIHKCVNLFYTFVYHSNLLKIILQGVIIIITYLESFKSLYHKAFYKFVLSVLSLPIFLYAVIKFSFLLREKFYANNSEISEIERALHQKYKYLSQQKSSTQIHKEALKYSRHKVLIRVQRILNKHIFQHTLKIYYFISSS